MPSKPYWPYQDKMVVAAVATTDDLMTDSPTGSGKTLVMVGTAALLLAEGEKVVIATPQQHIEQAFVDRDYDALVRTDGTVIPCPPELVRSARDEGGAIRAVLAYLVGPAAPGYAVACTHAAMALIDKPAGDPPSVALPADLTGCTLAVDEAHHASAAALSQVVEMWRRKGGRVLFYTATAFRHDGDPVLLGAHPVTTNPMQVYRRTLAEHMAEGFAPGTVVSEIVTVRVDQISAQEFAGLVVPHPAVQQRIVAEMLKRWQADERPKLIVRVPIMCGTELAGAGWTTSKTSAMVDRVVAAFQAAGARVLDVSGQTAADKARFLDKLPAERKVGHYNQSVVDVVVGVQRVNEGFDWPLASTAYVVGLPTSLVLTTQLLGRTTRLKGQAGYPADQAARAKLVLFVPCRDTGDTPADDALLAHHRSKTVLMCAHLQNATSAAEWAVVKAVGSGLVETMSDKPALTLGQVAVAYPAVDPVFHAEALAVFAKIRGALIKAKSAAPDVEVLERAYLELPQIPRNVLRQVMVEFIVQQTGQANAKGREKVRRALLAEIAANLEKGDELKAAIRDAFAQVVLALDSIAVVTSAQLGAVREQVIALTGKDIQEIGARLAKARPLTPEWLASVVALHHEEHGTFPSAKSTTGVPGWADESWAEIDQAIAKKERAWPLGGVVPSLASFVQRYAARGAVGNLLEQFRKEGRLTSPENALLDALLAQRVKIGGDVMAFGHTPVPALHGWPHPQWWVLGEWAKTAWQHPLAEVHAAVLVWNLAAWLKARGHKVPADAWQTLDGRATAAYAGDELVVAVPGESWVAADGTAFPSNKTFVAVAGPHPARPAAPLARKDGATPFKRSDAGYREAAVAAAPLLTAGGNPGLAGTVGAEAAFPLDWVTHVDKNPVRHDWDDVKDFAGDVLAKP